MSKKKVIESEPTIEEQQTEAGAEAQIEAEINANAEVVAPEVALEGSAPEINANAEVVVEELQEGGPIELTLTFAPEVPSRNIKVAIKSLEFRPRGKAGSYRAGGVYVLEATEALELIDAGIASLIEDPCELGLTFPDLDPEVE